MANASFHTRGEAPYWARKLLCVSRNFWTSDDGEGDDDGDDEVLEAGGVAEGITASTGVLECTGWLLGEVEMSSGTDADFPVCIGGGYE